jgi:hypothetical protein
MADDPGANTGFGNRFAGKLASHIVNAHVAGKVKSSQVTRGTGATILDDFFRLTGSELANTMGPTFKAIAEHPATDESMRPLFHFLARGNGQMATFLGGSVTGAVISGGLSDLITNLLAPVTHRIISATPNALLSLDAIASAVARGMSADYDMPYEAEQQGLGRRKLDVLVELARARPDVGVILELVNRGEMSADYAVFALGRLGYATADAGLILQTRHTLLTPAALADMVVRDIMAEPDAAAIAAKSGLSTEDFRHLVLDSGEAPGIQDLLFAHRRGFIDLARLEHGIRQSRVRNEWTDVIESLSHVPMSTADAIEAHVQGHLTEAQSRAIADQNGLMADHWRPLFETRGNPPGVQEMVSMWHRGVLTKDELIQGIKESRLKDKYIAKVIDAGVTLLPERSIVSLASKGGITDAEATDLLLRRGYAPDIVAALVKEAHVTKTAKQRELTASQIVALYEDRAIDQAAALAMLGTLGYDPEIAHWEITLADLRILKRNTDAAVSKVRALFVAHRIDLTEATTTLDSLSVAPAQREELLALWEIERAISRKELTPAEVKAAHKKGIISDQEYATRLRGLGYAPSDVAILLDIAGVDPSTVTIG